MSEYVTVEVRPTSDPDTLELVTNQTLTDDEREVYPDAAAGSEGSPLAQALFTAVEGLAALTITRHSLLIRREPGFPWEAIVDDVRDALRDFFL
ncbi:MAG: NifU N-terminal domain-containing protein [Aggregatilineales bacterium]